MHASRVLSRKLTMRRLAQIKVSFSCEVRNYARLTRDRKRCSSLWGEPIWRRPSRLRLPWHRSRAIRASDRSWRCTAPTRRPRGAPSRALGPAGTLAALGHAASDVAGRRRPAGPAGDLLRRCRKIAASSGGAEPPAPLQDTTGGAAVAGGSPQDSWCRAC